MSAVLDPATLAGWFEEYRPRLLAMLRRRLDPLLWPRLDPEDILSEAYLTAHDRCSRAGPWPAISPYPWLYRIVRDRLFDAWREAVSRCRDVRREQPWPDHSSVQLALGLVGSSTGPGEVVASADLRQRMTAVLRRLGSHDQEILWMRHYDQLSFREAAEVLDLSEIAATLRYRRALERLRDLWQRLYERGRDDP